MHVQYVKTWPSTISCPKEALGGGFIVANIYYKGVFPPKRHQMTEKKMFSFIWHISFFQNMTPEITAILSWIVSRATLPFCTSTTSTQGGRQACLAEVTSHPWAVGTKAVFATLRAIHKQNFYQSFSITTNWYKSHIHINYQLWIVDPLYS